MGKKEKQRKRVSTEWVYTGFYWWNHWRTRSVSIPVGDSADWSATSQNGYRGLNPSVIPSVKLFEKIHVIILLQLSKNIVSSVGDTNLIPDGLHRLVNTDRFGDKIISVGKNFWRKNYISNSVVFLWFSGSEIICYYMIQWWVLLIIECHIFYI